MHLTFSKGIITMDCLLNCLVIAMQIMVTKVLGLGYRVFGLDTVAVAVEISDETDPSIHRQPLMSSALTQSTKLSKNCKTEN